jgi:hypothetical protein
MMASTTMSAKIVSCRIGPYPSSKPSFDQKMPEVHATFDDGTSKMLFRFYPDELSFTEAEFIGLTEQEASQLFVTKDQAYLRS